MRNARPPAIAAQIDAVQWAAVHAWELGKRLRMRDAEIEEQKRRLDAAIETLRALEFGSAISR